MAIGETFSCYLTMESESLLFPLPPSKFNTYVRLNSFPIRRILSDVRLVMMDLLKVVENKKDIVLHIVNFLTPGIIVALHEKKCQYDKSLEHFLTKIQKSNEARNDPRDMSAAIKWWNKECYFFLARIVKIRMELQPWMEISTPPQLESQLPCKETVRRLIRVASQNREAQMRKPQRTLSARHKSNRVKNKSKRVICTTGWGKESSAPAQVGWGNLARWGSTFSVTLTSKQDKMSSARAQAGWGILAGWDSTSSVTPRSKQRLIRGCDSCIECYSTIQDNDLKSLVCCLLKKTGKRHNAWRIVKYINESKERVTQDDVVDFLSRIGITSDFKKTNGRCYGELVRRIIEGTNTTKANCLLRRTHNNAGPGLINIMMVYKAL